MSRGYPAIEGELEYELNGHHELELEDEFEQHEFEGEGEEELELEDEYGQHEYESHEYELEEEFEDEFLYEEEDEEELEFEYFADPNFRASRLGLASEAELMAHLATRAAEAESEAEAEAFLGPLISIAGKLAAKAAPKLLRSVGKPLVKGITKIGTDLWRRPQTRQLVKALPSVALNTVKDLATQWADGQQVTARGAIGTLLDNASKVSPAHGHPRSRQHHHRHHRPHAARRAVHATNVLNHRYHARPARRHRAGRR